MNRIVAQPPNPTNVHAGNAPSDIKDKVGKEGARTIPGRPEHGGNCDIKNLSRGSKVYLPVHVKGAKFSVGDLHFSQGDGEISFCGAIEMAGVITIKFTVMKGGVKALDMKCTLPRGRKSICLYFKTKCGTLPLFSPLYFSETS